MMIATYANTNPNENNCDTNPRLGGMSFHDHMTNEPFFYENDNRNSCKAGHDQDVRIHIKFSSMLPPFEWLYIGAVPENNKHDWPRVGLISPEVDNLPPT